MSCNVKIYSLIWLYFDTLFNEWSRSLMNTIHNILFQSNCNHKQHCTELKLKLHKSHPRLIVLYTNTGPSLSTHRTFKFSQFLNFESSLPNIHVNICLAFILARTTPRDLYQCAGEDSLPPSAEYCCRFRRIWFRIPTSNSSTLWLIPTDTSMNFALYVHARHLPSVDK